MKISLFTLCDYAQNNQGKLTLIGTFNRIASVSYPFDYSLGYYLVVKVVSRIAVNGSFELLCLDPHGNNFLPPLRGELEIQNPLNDDREKSFDLVVNLGPQIFNEPGTYQFVFSIGKLRETLDLYLDKK